MAKVLDFIEVKDHFQITLTRKLRKVLPVEKGDTLIAFEVEEYPDCVLIQKMDTTLVPVKKSPPQSRSQK